MNDNDKKKNILDLQFQKYLVIASTAIVVAFTYIIGVGIAMVSKQVQLDDFIVMGALFFISVGVMGLCAIAFFRALFHIRNIPRVLREL